MSQLGELTILRASCLKDLSLQCANMEENTGTSVVTQAQQMKVL